MDIFSQTITSDSGDDQEAGMAKLFGEHFSELVRNRSYADLRELYLKGTKRILQGNPAQCWFGIFRLGKLIGQGYTPGAQDTAICRIEELTRLTTVTGMLPVTNLQYSYLIEHPVMGRQVHVWTIGKRVSALEPWTAEPDGDGGENFSFEPIKHEDLMESQDLQIIMSRFGTFNSVFITSSIGRHDAFAEIDDDVENAIKYLEARGYELDMHPRYLKG